jgi:hypothetical protein
MIDEILNAYGARFVIAAGGVFLALVVLIAVLWILRNKAPSPFVRGGRSRQPRLQVLDATAVDTRRRLVLVRRDNIEHLILIGGPTDIVVESGIGEPKAYLSGELAANAALAEHQADEARLTRQEQAALQTPARESQGDEPSQTPVRPARRDIAPKEAPLELVMPDTAETPARREPAVERAASKPAATPEHARPIRPRPVPPEPKLAPQDVAPIAQRAVSARPPATEAMREPSPSIEVVPPTPEPVKPPERVTPPVQSKAPEPLRTEAPDVVVTPSPSQEPLPVRMEDASLALDVARHRVLAPKVEPFAAERFKAPTEPFDIPPTREPAPRVDPDMESIKSEFEKILDSDVQPEPTRPRPTVEPPVVRAIPTIDISAAPRAPSAASSNSGSGKEGNLQSEIARIFGEMGETRKD